MSLVPNRSSLPTADALYLDAVGATVRREFLAAITSYRKLLDLTPPADQANAYLDLGRAYEKNENLVQATESYLKAVNLAPQSPAGFLRLAVLYSRRQATKEAEEAFKKAEGLYKAAGSNNEGRVEVLYQRGALLARNGRPSEARAQLEQVLEILRNEDSKSPINNKSQLVKAQLQLSLVARDEGNIEGAKSLAAEAIQLAQTNNLNNIATNGLIDLGLTFITRGNFDEAGKYLRQALDLAQRENSLSTQKRAIMSLGRLNQQLGKNDEAIAQLKDALDFYQSRSGRSRPWRRCRRCPRRSR